MEIELSAHVRLRIGQRRLDLGWLERIVNHPEWREPEPSDLDLERRLGAIKAIGECGTEALLSRLVRRAHG